MSHEGKAAVQAKPEEVDRALPVVLDAQQLRRREVVRRPALRREKNPTCVLARLKAILHRRPHRTARSTTGPMRWSAAEGEGPHAHMATSSA